MNKAVAAVLGLAVLAGGAIIFWPSKASASPLAGGGGGAGPIDEGKPVNPANAAEAYGLGINPKMTDAAYVQKLADWMASSGNRPDWAAALQKRAYDLKAEELFAEGLKDTTSETRIIEIGNALKTTHEQLATVLGLRIAVMRGQAPPPAFQLQLPSGSGVLTIDLSVFAPHASPGAGGNSPVGPTPGGASPAPGAAASPATPPPGISPSAAQNTAPPGAPSNGPPASAPPAATPATSPGQPAGSPVNAHPLAAEETRPENDPFGTIALARVLLAEQAKSNWKYISEAVKQWQAKVGLTADGKFGPGSSLRMAQEVGVLPWVRYFAKSGPSTKAAAVNDYRGRLKAYALSIVKTKPELAGALLVSADNEQGQGWPATTPTPAPAKAPTPDQIDAAIAVLMKQADSRRV